MLANQILMSHQK